jgi:hypothetical protein
MIGFSVVNWAAWATGLQQRADWQAWSRAPWLPQGDEIPALAEVQPMQRRRIERLGRMAIQAACWCDAQAADDKVPMVFASRHGDVARSVALLKTLAADEALSPTSFGLSVHNAIAAFHSITSGGRGNYLAIAGGRSTAEAACVEAAGLLADGAEAVRVVCYEAPLPAEYTGFADEAEAPFAWCWQIAPIAHNGIGIELDWNADDGAGVADAALPHTLDVHRFLLSGDEYMAFDDGNCHWRWRRHA